MDRAPIAQDLTAAVGDTPLLRLAGPSRVTGCEILGKAEFMNPGGSVKDRAALGLIRSAERAGTLRPGGWIVEGTAGNTGIGLAVLGAALGYRVAIVIPRNQSREKKDLLRAHGAKLIEVEPVPYAHPDHYVRFAARLAEEFAAEDPRGAAWMNQFDNTANRDIHASTTGPEILAQCGGRLDGFICAVGTGGTLAGVGGYLAERAPGVRIGLADPAGAALYSYFTTGELRAEGNSITEGIGQSRITANLKGVRVDVAYRIEDCEMLETLYALNAEDGLWLGGSAGINVAGAMHMAREFGPGSRVVTILCDHGSRYQSKLFNPAFLAARGLPTPPWLAGDGWPSDGL
jgi:cysteine synthase A